MLELSKYENIQYLEHPTFLNKLKKLFLNLSYNLKKIYLIFFFAKYFFNVIIIYVLKVIISRIC